ncbi:MAG TPA: flagellin FliC [Gammaproteobacteria bacterium]|nr:flagellin FliC [Gammaproteobacteria bacterium]
MAASIINTNVMSLNAQKNLNKNSLSLATSVERLSSGLRVNSARDDAAGLAVAMSLQSTVRSLGVQIRNAADDISAAQISDGNLAVATDILQRMNELAVQATGTNGTAESSKIQVEFSALNAQLASLGAASVAASVSEASAISAVALELGSVATLRAGFGSTIAAAEFQVQRFETERVNQSAALSRIMDADFAMETANLTRGQILVQAGTAMVAQANQIPNNVLSLLR